MVAPSEGIPVAWIDDSNVWFICLEEGTAGLIARPADMCFESK